MNLKVEIGESWPDPGFGFDFAPENFGRFLGFCELWLCPDSGSAPETEPDRLLIVNLQNPPGGAFVMEP